MSTIRKRQISEPESFPCTGVHLEKLTQPAILAILAHGDLHGYRIVQELAMTPLQKGEKPDCTGVYRQLKNLEARGMVKSCWDLTGAGPAKRCFKITPEGRNCLGCWVKTLESYRTGISSLLNAARKACNENGKKKKSEPCCGSSRKKKS